MTKYLSTTYSPFAYIQEHRNCSRCASWVQRGVGTSMNVITVSVHFPREKDFGFTLVSYDLLLIWHCDYNKPQSCLCSSYRQCCHYLNWVYLLHIPGGLNSHHCVNFRKQRTSLKLADVSLLAEKICFQALERQDNEPFLRFWLLLSHLRHQTEKSAITQQMIATITKTKDRSM